MSFRRAFIGFALGLVVPGAALAQEARQIELGYEITSDKPADERIYRIIPPPAPTAKKTLRGRP